MRCAALRLGLGAAWAASLPLLHAGGSGLNVAVVVNETSSNSVQLANYYAERRQVPPQNIVRINWTGGNTTWTRAEFESVLRDPLNGALADRQLAGQIEFVVLSMDIPYKVTESNSVNSTTSSLFYGFKDDNLRTPQNPCTLPSATSSSYAGSEGIFRNTSPGTGTNTYLTTMITASNLALAKQLVDSGASSDGTFPTQSVLLAKSTDTARNIRYRSFDNAVFNTRLRGDYSAVRTNLNSPSGKTNLFGYQNGIQNYSVSPNAFLPGAMADNLTSFGGALFVPNDQTTLLAFTQAGAAGSYGTVVEPCAFLQKFPDPQIYFLQARGFSLAECYYQGVTNPYQGLLVGEPLAAPFRRLSSGSWTVPTANGVLSGTTNLSLSLSAASAHLPLQQVDLFIDGRLLQTLTNIVPRQGNVLNVVINGRSMNYTVPANATIKSVASGLAGVLNSAPNQNNTKVRAIARGDRVELQSFDAAKTGSQVTVSVNQSQGTAGALTTFISSSGTNLLDSAAWGLREFRITGSPLVGDMLELTVTKTNSAVVKVGVTNNTAGANATQFAQQLISAINANTDLQGLDGLAGEDLDTEIDGTAVFNTRARGQGFAAAQIQAALSKSLTSPLIITPIGTQKLNENLSDLEPRGHLQITAGATNLLFAFPFNTTTHPDGFHELTAVAYEGSHVRTQNRIPVPVRIQNTVLEAALVCLLGGSNTAVEATLQLQVTANTNTIAKIELFSTGGRLAVATNQSSAVFAVPGASLGLGLHPFHALVTDGAGKSYRTDTKFIRLVGAEAPFPLSFSAPPSTLSWPATAGRSYDILSAPLVTGPFLLRQSAVPTNSGPFHWTDPAPDALGQFYRVRTSP